LRLEFNKSAPRKRGLAASSQHRGAVTKVTPSPTTPAGFAYLFADA
ncbi:hypothetical protein PoMZ_02861, partial [Pyricularia oryzae]